MKFLIIGAGCAGLHMAKKIRTIDKISKIVLLEKSEHCTLSKKEFVDFIGEDKTNFFQMRELEIFQFIKNNSLDVRLLHEVVEVDKIQKQVKVFNKKTNEDYLESFDYLIVALGGESNFTSIDGIGNEKVFSFYQADDVIQLNQFLSEKNPHHVTIIGAGMVGLQLAQRFIILGLRVTMIEQANHVLPSFDFDSACQTHDFIKKQGIQLFLSASVKEMHNHNGKLIVATNKEEIETDFAVITTGIKPSSAILKEAGLQMNYKGNLIVNSSMVSSDLNIYAIGDVVETIDFVTKKRLYIPQLHTAHVQGDVVGNQIFGLESSFEGTQETVLLRFFQNYLGSTGINERTAVELGLSFNKIFFFSTKKQQEERLIIKLLYEQQSGKILGAQVLGGQEVKSGIDAFSTIIYANLCAKDFQGIEVESSYFCELFYEAGSTIQNILEGNIKVFHYHDLYAIQHNEEAILIDIRSKEEFGKSNIYQSVSLPFEQINEATELNKNKIYYIYCEDGRQSMQTCIKLNALGYECLFLSGGYQIYNELVLHGSLKETLKKINIAQPIKG